MPLRGARRPCTVSFHNFKSRNFKLSVSNYKSKYVAYVSVLSRLSNSQGLGRKKKNEILKTYRIVCTSLGQHQYIYIYIYICTHIHVYMYIMIIQTILYCIVLWYDIILCYIILYSILYYRHHPTMTRRRELLSEGCNHVLNGLSSSSGISRIRLIHYSNHIPCSSNVGLCCF